MKKFPRARREMATYTPNEIRLVLRAAAKDRNGHLWYLALSGLRRGEIAGVRWEDINFDAGTVTIARNRVQAGAGNVVENDPKTVSSCRTLPLDDGLVGVLKRASARYAEEKLALGASYADSGYVAVNEAGEPYTPDTLTRMWHKVTKTAGVRSPDGRHRQVAGTMPTPPPRRAFTPTAKTRRARWPAQHWGRLSCRADSPAYMGSMGLVSSSCR